MMKQNTVEPTDKNLGNLEPTGNVWGFSIFQLRSSVSVN